MPERFKAAFEMMRLSFELTKPSVTLEREKAFIS